MDNEHYYNLFKYLQITQIPENFNQQQKNSLIQKVRHFIIKNNLIYKKDKRKNGNLLRVVKIHEIEAILFMMHNNPTAGHFATDIMFGKIRD